MEDGPAEQIQRNHFANIKMKNHLTKINDFEWELSKSIRVGMNVNAKIIASRKMLDSIEEEAVQQLTNVAMLPGVINPVIAMPDAHWGYGLPMGAVSAFDAEEGIVSVGMVGFDINCGVNLIKTDLSADEVRKKIKELIPLLFSNIPCGVGAKGKMRIDNIDKVLTMGAKWCVENGYGIEEDLKNMEENGCMDGADPSKVSDLAKKRGKPQCGTLGAGNHFLEVQRVDQILDPVTAKKWGINDPEQVVIMLHCGSRGLGHQVATDYLKVHERAAANYGIKLPDKQLVCAPAQSKEAQDYLAAMKAATNYAFANRLVMTHWLRETFEKVFNSDWENLGMKTVYGIAHNICKLESHIVDGKKKQVYVHRKGATRSFPDTPVLIAGSMGTASYLLKGTETAMMKTFGSTCHGAGRSQSRHSAIDNFRGNTVIAELEKMGIISKATSPKVMAEEAPDAYKDIETVIDSVHGAGISLKVARLTPLGVIKG